MSSIIAGAVELNVDSVGAKTILRFSCLFKCGEISNVCDLVTVIRTVRNMKKKL